MRVFFRFIPVLFAAILIHGCTQPIEEETQPAPQQAQVSEEEIRSAVDAAGNQWVEAAKANDATRLASLYAPDAILMPPNDATVEGNASIRNWYNGFLNQFKVQDISTTTDEIIHAGEWAIRRGTYTMKFAPAAGGDPIEDSGKFMDVWRNVEGSWKIVRDIWNSNKPPAGEAQPETRR